MSCCVWNIIEKKKGDMPVGMLDTCSDTCRQETLRVCATERKHLHMAIVLMFCVVVLRKKKINPCVLTV